VFMQKIRRATYKHRKVLIAVVAVLCVGMVNFFAYNKNSTNYKNGSGEVSAVDQVAAYETYIAENEPEEMSGADYATATSMASMYMQLFSYCQEAQQEVSAADSAAAADYGARGQEAAAKAAEYYQLATDAAPDTMNDAALAQLYTNRANALFYAGETEEARALFEQAAAKTPDAFSVVSAYAGFIFSVDGLEAAQSYLNSYMATQDAGGENYAGAQELLNRFQFLHDVYGLKAGEAPAGAAQ